MFLKALAASLPCQNPLQPHADLRGQDHLLLMTSLSDLKKMIEGITKQAPGLQQLYNKDDVGKGFQDKYNVCN